MQRFLLSTCIITLLSLSILISNSLAQELPAVKAPAMNQEAEKSVSFQDIISSTLGLNDDEEDSTENDNPAITRQNILQETLEAEKNRVIERIDMPVVSLSALDKITGRTQRFDVNVGDTVRFGSIYIMTRSCKENAPLETPESAAFLQIWEVDPEDGPEWLFSNYMFASNPSLAAMDHPIYDIWVTGCKNDDTNAVSDEKPSDSAE